MEVRKKQSVLVLLVLLVGLTITSCKKEDFRPQDNPHVAGNQGIGDGSEITLYKVNGDQLVKEKDYSVSGQALSFQQDTQKHQEVWNLVMKIVPPAYRNKISEFLIYSGKSNGTAGFVEQTSSDLSTWKMGIAIDFAYEGGFNTGNELSYTIIHEFAHILTLDNTQVDAYVSENDCSNYFPGEGCARTNSFINKHVSSFWSDILVEHTRAENKGDRALQKFYQKYQDRFVTDYAATNPGEDIAETFAVFVTRSDQPIGGPIKEQKVGRMYQDTELVQLRNYIRENLGGLAKNGKSLLPKPGQWKQAKVLKRHGNCLHHQ